MLAPSAMPSGQRTTKLIPVPIHRTRLLLVSDSPECMRTVQGSVSSADFDITYAGSLDELLIVCRDGYDVVVLDVAPAKLAPMLQLIRASEQTAGIPVLVEASRINNDLNLVGVLPQYRAMPCNRMEMLRLLKARNENGYGVRNQRGML